MNRFTPKYLLPGLALLLSGLALNQWTIYSNATTIREHQLWVEHSQRVFSRIELLRASVLEAESSVRSYVISHRSAQLDSYYAAIKQIPTRVVDLEEEINSSGAQRSRLEQIRQVLNPRLDLLRNLVRNEERHPDNDPDTLKLVDEGNARMNELRALLDAMASEEKRLLDERARAKDLALSNAANAFVGSTIFMSLLTLLAYGLLRHQLTQRNRQDWFDKNLARLNLEIGETENLSAFCRQVLDFLAKTVEAPLAIFFLSEGNRLVVAGGLALPPGSETKTFDKNQGVVGEAARRRRIMVVQESSARVVTGSRQLEPAQVMLIPLEFEGQNLGVIELCALQPYSPEEIELCETFRTALGTGLQSVLRRAKLQELLEETQTQAEELQSQQEELRQSNEELEQQARALEEQQLITAQQNQQLQQQTSQLSVASNYKSQFLANMSHELRTPLNSLLILSSLLADNKGGRLNDQEIEFARTIHNSGNDLLALINDVLDLAKIESGNVRLEVETVELAEVMANLERVYGPGAREKGLTLEFSNTVSEATLQTDRMRLEQILRNFLSNALKFTERGTITVRLSQARDGLRFAVEDSGIGIPEDKLDQIFAAFQQADGSTSRLYGGTGLGLTISRELAHLLGGRIEVESRPGQGSSFQLVLPAQAQSRPAPAPAQAPPPTSLPQEPYLLLVEDDLTFGNTLLALAEQAGFQALLVRDGETALATALEQPPLAILLDVKLPTLSGLAVLERLKSHSRTRHIPVHMISGVDHTMQALRLGAMGYLVKPASREQITEVMARIFAFTNRSEKSVLIVEDDRTQRESLTALLNSSDIPCQSVATGAEAFERVRGETFDCLILDLHLPDTTGFDLLKRMESELTTLPPVVVYTGKDLTRKEEEELRRYSESIILKGVRSPERLLEEVGLFLHRLQTTSGENRAVPSFPHFQDRKILLADDDLRNTFALMSVLEPEGFQIRVVRNGKEALAALEEDPGLELVLMDIMMPEMDGLEATRRIRQDPRWKNLPVIALTAKAMKEDQERCLDAGASDYLTKPFKVDHLLSLLRVWLPAARFARD